MKKRIVITTEKREVWVISEGGIRREMSDQPQDDLPAPGTESLITNQDDSDKSSSEEGEERHE